MRIIVPKLRFKEFNNDFIRYNLEDVSFIMDGTHQTPNYKKSGIKFISVEDIENICNSRKFISELDYEKNFIIKPQYNDIFMTRITAGVIGATAIKKDHEPLAFYVSLALIRPNNANTEYLNYYINSPYFRHELFKKIIHVAFPKKINLNDIGKCKITLPQIEEQEKIGKLFELLDKKNELQKQKIEALKLYKKGLLQKIMNQNGEKIRLKDILVEYSKKTTINNEYEIISSTKEGLFLQKEYFNRSIASENNIGYKILKIDQVVLSPQNLWMGNINYNDKYEIGIVSPSYKIFNINTEFNKYYVSNLLKSEKALYYYIISSEQGASIVRRNLNMEAFEEITFNIPDRKTQNIIGINVKLIDYKIKLSENKFNYLYNYKKSLLQQMFV